MEENRRFSLSDLFIKIILVIIFVLFTVWLLSISNKGLSNSLDVLKNNIFSCWQSIYINSKIKMI